MNSQNTPKIATTTCEMIRLFQGLFYYRNSVFRIRDLLSSSAYSFFNTRNHNWVKNRINYLQSKNLEIMTDELTFHQFIHQVKSWSPDKFTADQRLEYMHMHRVVLSDEQKKRYFLEVEHETQEWYKSDMREKLAAATPLEIFCAVVNDKSECHRIIQIKYQITDWSKSYIPISTPIDEGDVVPGIENASTAIPKTESPNNNNENEVLEQYHISKLFKKYEFTEFSSKQALSSCFNYRNRPDTLYWKSLLDKHVTKNILISNKTGKKILYKFNSNHEYCLKKLNVM